MAKMFPAFLIDLHFFADGPLELAHLVPVGASAARTIKVTAFGFPFGQTVLRTPDRLAPSLPLSPAASIAGNGSVLVAKT